VGLRETAAADLQAILEDTNDFGWPITVTDPNEFTASLTGFSTDVHETIDPETGLAVSGRTASVAIALASLTAVGLAIPRAIADSASKPWVVTFDDIEGNEYTFKVQEARPDRALGVVVCLLEAYNL
jgi:hypothetical protein